MSIDYRLTLSEEQRQFFDLLERQPSLKPYWDMKTREANIDALEQAMKSMSHGECCMARFFMALWLHDNKIAGFDLMEAVDCLDQDNIDVIKEWLHEPFWP